MACYNSSCQIARTATRHASRLTPNPFQGTGCQQQQCQVPANWGGEVVSAAANPVRFSTRSRKTYRKTPFVEAGTMTRAQLAPTALVSTQSRPLTTIRRAKSLGAGILTSARQFAPTNFIQEAPVSRVVTQRSRRLLGKSTVDLSQSPTVYNTGSPVYQGTIVTRNSPSTYGNTIVTRNSPSTFGNTIVTRNSPSTYGNTVVTRNSPSGYVQASPTVYSQAASVNNVVSPTIYSQAAAPVSYESVGQQVYNSSPVSVRSPTIRRSTGLNTQVVSTRISPGYGTTVRVPSTRVRLASGSPSIIPTSTRSSRRRGLSLAAPRAAEFTKDNLPPLPPVNSACCGNVAVPQARSTRENVQLPGENRVINLYDNDVKTVVRDVNRYKTFLKTVVTTVNRNHVHTNRVVENQNNHNTYLTNNVIKVNDIHRQRIERVPGEVKNFDSRKQTQRIEPAVCGGCQNEY